MDLLHLWNVFSTCQPGGSFVPLPSCLLLNLSLQCPRSPRNTPELPFFIHISIIVMHHCQPVSHLLQSACEAQYLKAASLSLNKKGKKGELQHKFYQTWHAECDWSKWIKLGSKSCILMLENFVRYWQKTPDCLVLLLDVSESSLGFCSHEGGRPLGLLGHYQLGCAQGRSSMVRQTCNLPDL